MDQDSRKQLSAYPMVTEIPLRYGDVDRQGHLNNVAIAELYQQARVALWEQVVGPITPDTRIIVVEQTIKFLGEGFTVPTFFGNAISRIGRSSYGVAHGMFQNGRCIGLCDTALVHVGKDGRPAPLPDAMRAAFEAVLLRPAG